MREKSGFEKLNVFIAAEGMADAVWVCVKRWPNLARDTVGKQLVRAADSVGANIAEGYGRGRNLDNRRFVRIALGSLYEAKFWLRRAYARELLAAEDIETLKPLMESLLKMLNGYLKSIVRAKPTPYPPPPTP